VVLAADMGVVMKMQNMVVGEDLELTIESLEAVKLKAVVSFVKICLESSLWMPQITS